MLVERHMPELTAEAVFLRHREQFEDSVVIAARARLADAVVDVGALSNL